MSNKIAVMSDYHQGRTHNLIKITIGKLKATYIIYHKKVILNRGEYTRVRIVDTLSRHHFASLQNWLSNA